MYRVCVGKASKDTGSGKGSRDTERGEITISYALSARNLNYLNYKRIIIYNNLNNINQQHIARKTTHCALKGYMINNEDNSLVKDNLDNLGDNKDNDDQQYKQ